MENLLSLKQEYKSICENSPLVNRIEESGEYFKIYTNILVGDTDTFLNLYLIFDEDEVCLSDSNEIYRICEGYYELSDENLENLAKIVELDYNYYRFTKIVTADSINFELEKFEKLIGLVIKE